MTLLTTIFILSSAIYASKSAPVCKVNVTDLSLNELSTLAEKIHYILDTLSTKPIKKTPKSSEITIDEQKDVNIFDITTDDVNTDVSEPPPKDLSTESQDRHSSENKKSIEIHGPTMVSPTEEDKDSSTASEINTEETVSDDHELPKEGTVSGDHELRKEGTVSGDHELPKEGTVSGDHELPKEGTVSGDPELPKEGTESGDHELSKEGTVSGDPELPKEGTVSGDHELPKEEMSTESQASNLSENEEPSTAEKPSSEEGSINMSLETHEKITSEENDSADENSGNSGEHHLSEEILGNHYHYKPNFFERLIINKVLHCSRNQKEAKAIVKLILNYVVEHNLLWKECW